MLNFRYRNRAHWVVFGLGFIKKLLRQHEQNVIPLSQEGEYRTQNPDGGNFSFSIFFL